MRRVLLSLLVGGSVLMAAAGLAFMSATPREALPAGWRLEDVLPVLALPLAAAAVGTMLAVRRPENRVGWYLLLVAALTSAHFSLGGFALYGLLGGDLPGAAAAAWVFNWWGSSIAFVIFAVIVMVPEGRIATGWGRAALWSFAAAIVLLTPSVALRPGPLPFGHFVDNPYALAGAAWALDSMAALGLLSLAAALLFLVRHFMHMLRMATGALAQQIKWIVWSALVVIPAVVLWFTINVTDIFIRTPDATLSHATRLITMFAMTMIPVSIGIAILRYRLYDIDVLINRTLVYAILTATLVATYVGAVIGTQALLGPLTGGNEVAIAASTLLVVALFQPVRRRIQDAVDRRFYRSRYDAARALDALAAQLRDEVELASVRSELLAVIGDTLQPAHASLWLRER